MWWKESCFCAKARTRRPCWRIFTPWSNKLNDHILPPGVKIVPLSRPRRSGALHHSHGASQPRGRHDPGRDYPLHFSGQCPRRPHRRLTIPFALLFASICLDLRHISANLLSLGALDFGMVVDGAVVMVENIVRHLNRAAKQLSLRCSTASAKPRMKCNGRCFYAIAIIITAYLPIFTLQRVEGKLFKPDGVDSGFRLAGRADLLDADCARRWQACFPGRASSNGRTRSWNF